MGAGSSARRASGRFVADKLASRLEVATRRKGSKEVHASFSWDDYDDDSRLLSEVKNTWEERSNSNIVPSGTLLRMSRLRTRWNERMFRRLCTRLARLVSPFGDRDEFRIIIDSDEFPDYSGELRNDLLNHSPYQLEGSFDGDDIIQAWVGNRKWKARWPGPGSLTCGPVKVRLHAFDLDTTSLARIGPNVEVRAWLREWSGVNVYRDGFRVWPYGEPHDDWLGLDQRRVNNPVVRLSNNQVIGFVEISRDANPLLLDQTNREGLIHNSAFEDLRRLVHYFFLEIENHRQTIRHPGTGRAESTAPRVRGLSTLERLAGGSPCGGRRPGSQGGGGNPGTHCPASGAAPSPTGVVRRTGSLRAGAPDRRVGVPLPHFSHPRCRGSPARGQRRPASRAAGFHHHPRDGRASGKAAVGPPLDRHSGGASVNRRSGRGNP